MLLKLTIKFGPLKWETCRAFRDGADFERYVSQLGPDEREPGMEFDGPEIPARAWRELVVYGTEIQKAQWFTEWRQG